VTSQVFANIYLNEFDRFVSHTLRPVRYMRYGDDVLLFADTRKQAQEYRQRSVEFFREVLHLEINTKSDILVPVRTGIRYLGVELFPSGGRLLPHGRFRVQTKLSGTNIGSYYGLIHAHENKKRQTYFDWSIIQQNTL